MQTIITHSDRGETLARTLQERGIEASFQRSPKNYKKLWHENDALIFIGALGICVRELAPFFHDKKSDPAVVNIDAEGCFVQPVLSGHLGGANELARHLSRLIGATPVITTNSDTSGLWSLDMLAGRYNWQMECSGDLTRLTAAFVNGKKTALLLEARDEGTLFLESSAPSHVDVFYDASELNISCYQLIIAVSPFVHDFGSKAVFYRPPMVHVGLGGQRGLPSAAFESAFVEELITTGVSPLAVASLGTVDIKKDEEAFVEFAKKRNIPLQSFAGEELAVYDTPNPSQKVGEITGSRSVAEASAMHLSGHELWSQKKARRIENLSFTYAVTLDRYKERKGFVEIVGAGPGDPELVSVRGKRMLASADLILYAGSLVPQELTHYAKPGCVVKSSASMNLEKQIETMKAFYDRGLFIVRLHTGDPCIYGAVLEQMNLMDQYSWRYHITPGISSFQAAAAALESQFTIPGEVQTIVLTRGEGRTPVPDREKLRKLAASQSTMCIYLSAALAQNIQRELMEHYPPETPVAICYKLTWKDERIYRCALENLARTVEEQGLTMTTLIVVGKAIGNRKGVSKLYDRNFTHAFRSS